MIKVINSIVVSATPPSNFNVLWLDISSGSPILMAHHRGQWAPILTPVINGEEQI